MTKNKLRKAAVIALAGLMMTQTALTGCGKKEVNYNLDGSGNGDGSGGSKAGSSRSGIGAALGVPDGCDESIDAGNTGIGTISFKDDEIQVPDTDKMNVLHFTPSKFGNEEKKAIVEGIFEKDKGIYKYDEDHMTKADYQQIIDNYKEQIESAKGEGDDSWVTYLEEEMKNYEEKLAKAPDEYEDAGDYDSEGFIGTMNGMQYSMNIYAPSDEDGDVGLGTSIYLSPKDDMISLRPHDGADQAWVSSYKEPGVDLDTNTSKMTKEEAEDIAGKFLSDIGITDVLEKEANDMIWEYASGKEGETVARECDGYIIEYSRAIGGSTSYNGYLYSVDNLMTNDGWINMPIESYSVYVYDGKVIEANWNQVFSKADSVDENVELLTYDQMLEKAKTEIPKYYEKYKTQYKNITFNDVSLTYYIVSDGEGKCKYTPVWVFSQYQERQDSEGAESPEQLVIMNAMDGTVVDLLEEAKAMGCYQEYN